MKKFFDKLPINAFFSSLIIAITNIFFIIPNIDGIHSASISISMPFLWFPKLILLWFLKFFYKENPKSKAAKIIAIILVIWSLLVTSMYISLLY